MPPVLEEGSKVRLLEVPHGMRQKETLSPDLVRTIAQWAMKAEDHFGSPQDVEWAITDGQFYMLQSRPITAMGREEIGRDIEGEYVIFKPLVENFTDPVTPLTGDCFKVLFAPPLMRLIKGWLYVSIKHFRAILPFKVSGDELAAILYEFGSKPPSMRLSLLKLPFFLCLMFFSYLFFGVFFARTRGLPGDFMDSFRELAQKVDEDPAFGPLEAAKQFFFLVKNFRSRGEESYDS